MNMYTFRGWILATLAVASCAWFANAFADCAVPSTPNDGYFDQTWGNHGCVVFVGDNRNAGTGSQVDKLATTSGSNVFLGGTTFAGSGAWWIGEITDTGQFDPAFGDSDSSGRITECQLFLPGVCQGDQYFDFLPQPDGRILALSNRYLARTTIGGHAFDTTVAGGSGYVSSQFPISTPPGPLDASTFGALAYSADGNLLVAGNGYQSLVASYQLEGIARLGSDLSVDASFHAETDSGVIYAGGNFFGTGSDSQAHQVLVRSTGKLIVFGSNSRDMRVTRLNVDGSVDTTFGSGGTTILSTPPAGCSASYYPTVPFYNGAIDRADRIVVIASCFASAPLTVVARLSTDGALDTANFGNGGYYVNAPFAACPDQIVQPYAVVIDSAGRILVVGTCDSQFGVQRLRGDGTLDTSFGIGGLASGKFDPASSGDQADAIILDHGGRPIIGGYTQLSPRTSAVARLTYDLIYTNDFETAPRGCLPPDCN
jgi:uncharacterized delta-60 repeat protein